ncbi:alpha/beta fold hydrolase [Aggregatilinea lenta]|uniref:alpha/beta fold hydrolase n=1 Tax=Aggregatilinea lenta TaxID=913108 RepID=UPI000E5C2B87|nr:alpha/beta fold hydrolase [Aggregatilinea lenta]
MLKRVFGFARSSLAALPWPSILAVLVLLALAAVFGLPFVLPLGGPELHAAADLADANGMFATVDNTTLYYTHLPGSQGPVVLVHGFGGSTVTWTGTMAVLARAGYEVYAVDLAGYGLSEKGWDIDYRDSAQAARILGLIGSAWDRAGRAGRAFDGWAGRDADCVESP